MQIDGSKQATGSTFQILAKHSVIYTCMWDGCDLPVRVLGKNQTSMRANDPNYVGQLKTHRKYCRVHGAEAGLLRAQMRRDAAEERESLGRDITTALAVALCKAQKAYDAGESSPGMRGNAFVRVAPGNCVFARMLYDIAPFDSIGGGRRFPVGSLLNYAREGAMGRSIRIRLHEADQGKQQEAAVAFCQAFAPEQLVQFGTKKKELALTIELSL